MKSVVCLVRVELNDLSFEVLLFCSTCLCFILLTTNVSLDILTAVFYCSNKNLSQEQKNNHGEHWLGGLTKLS